MSKNARKTQARELRSEFEIYIDIWLNPSLPLGVKFRQVTARQLSLKCQMPLLGISSNKY